MKKILLVTTLALLASCGANNNKSGAGFLVTSTTDAVFVDNNVHSAKRGEACSTRVLSLFATGDASIDAAKSNARISRVATVDTKHFNILGIYGSACTVVKGE